MNGLSCESTIKINNIPTNSFSKEFYISHDKIEIYVNNTPKIYLKDKNNPSNRKNFYINKNDTINIKKTEKTNEIEFCINSKCILPQKKQTIFSKV